MRYRVRHDPGGSRALALFGPAGERARWPLGRRRPVGDALLARLGDETGIPVAPVPRVTDLREVLD